MSDYIATPNQPCWFQIPAHDLRRAAAFYESALSFTLRGLPDDPTADEAVAQFSFPGGPFANCLTGGIIKIPECLQAPMQASTARFMSVIYFYTDDMEATLEKIRKAGGTVIRARSDIKEEEGDSWCADFKDTEGNFHGLYTNAAPK